MDNRIPTVQFCGNGIIVSTVNIILIAINVKVIFVLNTGLLFQRETMESNMFQANVQTRVVDLYKTNKNKNALKILDTISYFSSDNISEKYLLDLVGGRKELESAVKLLKKYSVVNLSQEPFGLSISMPAQEAVREILKEKKKEEVTLRDVLSKFGDDLECAGSLSHPISTWNYAIAYENLIIRYSSIPCKIVRKLGNYDRNSEAHEFGLKQLSVLKECKSAGKICLKYEIGNLFFKEGEFEEALKWYKAEIGYRDGVFLRYAATDGFLDIAKFILEEKGIDDVFDCNRSLMHYAVEGGNIEVVKLFVKKGVNMEFGHITPVRYATKLNKLDIVKFLVESGANVNYMGSWGDENLVNTAAEYGHLDILKYLVKSGVDFELPGYKNMRPLHVAAEGDHLDCVKFLVKSGADVNVTACGGRNSLHWAADIGNLNMIRFLIKNGANINLRNNSLMTPLDIAVEKIDPVGIIDHKGSTLLHYAVYFGYTNLVKKILKLVKSDQLHDFLDCRTKGGNIAMDLAIKSNNKAIIKILDNAWKEVSSTI